jgi:hypothetical protein
LIKKIKKMLDKPLKRRYNIREARVEGNEGKPQSKRKEMMKNEN